jgi:hypothetical protein
LQNHWQFFDKFFLFRNLTKKIIGFPHNISKISKICKNNHKNDASGWESSVKRSLLMHFNIKNNIFKTSYFYSIFFCFFLALIYNSFLSLALLFLRLSVLHKNSIQNPSWILWNKNVPVKYKGHINFWQG